MKHIGSLPWQPYKADGKYPHMMGGDIPTWEKFIRAFPDTFDEVAYDVHVGQGADIRWTTDPSILRWGKELTQLRIDVLAKAGDSYWIVEVRRLPGVQSLGQLIAYKMLFERDFGRVNKLWLSLLCDYITRDIEYAAKQLNIQTVTLGRRL